MDKLILIYCVLLIMKITNKKNKIEMMQVMLSNECFLNLEGVLCPYIF